MKLSFALLFLSSMSYAACVGPYCYDDTGAYVNNLHVSSITYVDGTIQGSSTTASGVSNPLTVGTITIDGTGQIVTNVDSLIGPPDASMTVGAGANQFLEVFGSSGTSNTSLRLKYEIDGTVRLPLFTTTQRNSLSPAEGDMIYNTTNHAVEVSTKAASTTSWVAL